MPKAKPAGDERLRQLEAMLHVGEDAVVARAAQLQTWLEKSPAYVWIAHDRECSLVTGSEAAAALVGAQPRANMSTSGANAPRMRHMTVWRDGVQLRPDEMPLQRAARGEEVIDYTMRLVFDDGRDLELHGSAVPLRGAGGEAEGAIATFVDVSRLRRVEEQLRASEERARTQAEQLTVLLDTAPAALWIASDPECRDIRGSRFAHEILRMHVGDNLSLTPGDGAQAPAHFSVRNRGQELPPEELPVQRAARGETLRNFEEEIVFDDGGRVWLFGNAVPLHTPDGAPAGAIGAFVDVTDYKRVQEELRLAAEERERLLIATEEARAAAEAANAAKDQFLATVSHELRTPLNTVMGYLQMLRSNAVGPERRDAVLEIIQRNADLQMQLIDDILDVSRITAGRLPLEMSRVELTSLVAESLDAAAPIAQARELTLTRTLSPDQYAVLGDRRRLRQVFGNVLTNAVKFTPAGGRIDVSVQPHAAGVEVVVADTGVGIDPEFLPRVFDRFTQGRAGLDPGRSGLGLGLNIAHHLVQQHRGTIHAESDGAGRGTRIRIRLPLVP